MSIFRSSISRISRLKVIDYLFIFFSLLILSVITFPTLFSHYDPNGLDIINRLQPPSVKHLFGTDEGGRDIFTRLLHGARDSLGATILIVGFAGLMGTIVGSLAGWFGGRFDIILMRLVDVFLSFPYLVLAMALASALGRDLKSAVISLSLVWWPSFARLVRGQILSIKEKLFIHAVVTLGASDWQILRWHIIPHLYRSLTVKATMDFGYALIALTGLSFLGLGAQSPSPEWGLMISGARSYALVAWWYTFFPGLFIIAIVSFFSLLGEHLSGDNK